MFFLLYEKDRINLQSLLWEKYLKHTIAIKEIEKIVEFDVSESTINKTKDYVMDKVQKKIGIPFKFEPRIGQTKTALFANIWNEYYRKAPEFLIMSFMKIGFVLLNFGSILKKNMIQKQFRKLI